MIYGIFNRLTNQIEQFDDAVISNAFTIAQQKLNEYTIAYIQQEALRFHIAKIEHNDVGEVWHNLGVNEPENADYRVLNQYTGEYTAVTTLADAVALAEERKQQFITDLGDKVFEIVPLIEEKDVEEF